MRMRIVFSFRYCLWDRGKLPTEMRQNAAANVWLSAILLHKFSGLVCTNTNLRMVKQRRH